MPLIVERNASKCGLRRRGEGLGGGLARPDVPVGQLQAAEPLSLKAWPPVLTTAAVSSGGKAEALHELRMVSAGGTTHTLDSRHYPHPSTMASRAFKTSLKKENQFLLLFLLLLVCDLLSEHLNSAVNFSLE